MLNFDVILASASPRRKTILSQVDLDFTIEPSKINEDFSIDLLPKAFCEHWAREKAIDIAKSHSDKLIIGADTIVKINDTILGKPKNYKESFAMLKSLSGKTHQVLTGVSLIHLDLGIDFIFNETTNVSFCFLTDEEINNYIDKYKPLIKLEVMVYKMGFLFMLKGLMDASIMLWDFRSQGSINFIKLLRRETY